MGYEGAKNSNNCTDPSLGLQTMLHPGSLCGGETNVVCNCCYIILLFGVLFLFIPERKECAYAVQPKYCHTILKLYWWPDVPAVTARLLLLNLPKFLETIPA